MTTIKGQYFNEDLAKSLKKIMIETLQKDSQRLKLDTIITEENVFQEAVKENRALVTPFVKECLLEGSTILGIENWDLFYKNFKNGQSSLILSEHKSNLDVVIFFYLMDSLDRLKAFDEIIFVAGRKLNEESSFVRIFAEMYNRLMVVPKSETQDADEENLKEIYKINYAAQQFIKNERNNYIYLIYPTATRSRPWEPESYEGITETVNYLEKFDQVIFLSADGNCMFPLPGVPMESEPLIQDKIVLRFSAPVPVKDFIKEQQNLFINNFPKGSRQELKAFITKAITQKIYSQKPMHPREENWTQKINEFLVTQKKIKEGTGG